MSTTLYSVTLHKITIVVGNETNFYLSVQYKHINEFLQEFLPNTTNFLLHFHRSVCCSCLFFVLALRERKGIIDKIEFQSRPPVSGFSYTITTGDKAHPVSYLFVAVTLLEGF